MKCLITGLNGTVAPFLAQHLTDSGHEILPWNRSVVPPDDLDACRSFLEGEAPDAFFHLATGSPVWAETVAHLCSEADIPFLFTSSVSVFSSTQTGPFQIEDTPQPDDDYGRYKLECEQRIRAACPEARIVRLGWQIGDESGGNQMVDYLDRIQRENGKIAASVHRFQACSFLPDTAFSLAHVLTAQPAGLYHLDSNPGLHFHEVVSGLNRLLGEPWTVEPNELPVQNNLLADRNLHPRPINTRFPS